MPSTPNPAAEPKGNSEEPPGPADFHSSPPPWPGLDRLGITQAIGGFVLGLIALLSSYDHITFAGHAYPLPQQWGIPCIAASVATVLVDAQLATRARDRAAYEANRDRDLAREERQRADQERNRAAEARERQRTGFARLDRSALLSARVQLDPSESNRARLQAFLALIAGSGPTEEQGL